MTSQAQNNTRPLEQRGQEGTGTLEKERQACSSASTQEQQEVTAGGTTVERDFEGGFGGQEDLEDRYATTSGEH